MTASWAYPPTAGNEPVDFILAERVSVYGFIRRILVEFEYGTLASVAEEGMGLAPGGRMKQDIYDDPYGLDAWDQRHGSRCFVSLVNATQWLAITGERPPTEPPTAQDYAACGLPWFEYYGGDARALAGSDKLRGLTSVADHTEATGQAPLANNETVAVPHVVALGKPRRVREAGGDWART